jgi:hypothetical protein
MKPKTKTIVISTLISIGLLILFLIVNLLNSDFLNLDVKWIIVSGVPLLIGLILSGAIKNFKGFGLELETNLTEKVEIDLIAEVESYPTPELTKGSIELLHAMTPKAKHSIQRLQFIYGKKQYYDPDVVREYINALNNLRYIEIVDEYGKFVSLISAESFKEKRERWPAGVANTRIMQLIHSIEEKNILNDFKNVITTTIFKDDTLLQAYKKFNHTDQGKLLNSDKILPVVDSNYRMVGITRRCKLADKIAAQVLKSEK